MCTFDDNFINLKYLDECIEIADTSTTKKSTDTLSYKSFSSICDKLYNVMKKKSTLVVGMLLEMKKVIMSKHNNNLDLNKIITHFDNSKNTFTPLQKWYQLTLIEPSSCYLNENVKRETIYHEII